MILQRDQRQLLKLRGSTFIQSDLDYNNSIFKVKKCKDTQRMLHMIVDNIRQKKIEGMDLKLLNIAGLNEIIEILRIRE